MVQRNGIFCRVIELLYRILKDIYEPWMEQAKKENGSVMLKLKHNPLLGVFVKKSIITRLHKQEEIFGIKGLWEAGKQTKTDLYFFSIDDVDKENLIITGTYFNAADNKWERGRYPFPNVIYNRRSEGSVKVVQFREMARLLNIKTINPISDFNKWDLYQQLSGSSISKYMPYTIVYQKDEDLQVFLDRFNSLYLKAVIGRYSRKVMRVRKLKNGSFEYSFVDDQLRLNIVDSWELLIKEIGLFFRGRKFIIQEEIHRFRSGDQDVDMRAELQRDAKGHLQVVAISARVAAPNSPVTTIRANTKVYKFEEYFRENLHCSNYEFAILLSRVYAFLKKVYMEVEVIYGSFGEMGVDFALDQNLNLWLIECNSKSAKIALFMSHDECVINRAFRNPLEYASCYLLGSFPT